MLGAFISGVLFLVALWASFFVLYQLVLAGLYFLVEDKPIRISEARNKFAAIIPAHNEEMMIGTAMDSWEAIHYPQNLFVVHVIADNCTDRTAEIAQAHGAVCLAREDTEHRGKGQALAWALERLPLDTYDAVVVVDADTTVSPEFLTVMNNRLVSGAKVIQGYNGILNPDDSQMTRLMKITNVMKNLLFNHAKSKLGLSVKLMGTGMCFTSSVLEQVGWKAFSIGEDGEQFAYLAEADIQVEYEPFAIVYAQEATSFGQAYTQRLSWASGRMELVGHGVRLFMKGFRRFDLRLIDASLAFLIPNYSMLANFTLFGLIIILLVDLPGRSALLPWYGFLLGAQTLYLFVGVALSNLSVRAVSSLSFAPLFLIWKVVIDLIALIKIKRLVWIRASRAPHK